MNSPSRDWVPENDNNNWYSNDVGVQGYFHLHLSASDYEKVVCALDVTSNHYASEYLDCVDIRNDSFIQLHDALMVWNHCDYYWS